MNDWEKRLKSLTDFSVPEVGIPAMPEIDFEEIHRALDERAGRLDAEGIFEHLSSRVSEFQRTMPKEHEIGLKIANLGVAATLHIRKMAFRNPNLIEFSGILADGNEATLVQHISQLNLMLVSVAPIRPNEPYRVGF